MVPVPAARRRRNTPPPGAAKRSPRPAERRRPPGPGKRQRGAPRGGPAATGRKGGGGQERAAGRERAAANTRPRSPDGPRRPGAAPQTAHGAAGGPDSPRDRQTKPRTHRRRGARAGDSEPPKGAAHAPHLWSRSGGPEVGPSSGKRDSEDGQGGASRRRRGRRQRPPERPPVYGGPSTHENAPGRLSRGVSAIRCPLMPGRLR